MSDFDIFCSQLLEESKRFFEKAKTEKDQNGKRAYQHACLLIAICSLESFINSISEEMCLSPRVPTNVKAILMERDLRLERGEFIVSSSLKMSRLTDRIEILYRRYSGEALTDNEKWWEMVKTGIDLRNRLSHPKDETKITIKLLERILEAIVGCLDSLYKKIYKRKFPKSHLQLSSSYDF